MPQVLLGRIMFYTYLWLREDGTPYYAGKGKGNRGFESRGHRVHCPPKNRIIIQEWPSEEDAFEAEKFLVAYYGRMNDHTGCLANLTDGGEGVSGLTFKHTEEARKKISEAGLGRIPPPRSAEWRKKQSESHKGRSHTCSDETRNKMSLAALGNKKGQKLSERRIAFILLNSERGYFTQVELAGLYGVTKGTILRYARQGRQRAAIRQTA
jgi:hypothetical protein